MNLMQQRILKGALAAFVLTLLFPPFLFGFPGGGTSGIGFGFILTWPEKNNWVGYIDVPLLLAEWLAVSVIGALLWLLTKNKDPKADITWR